LRTKYKRDYLFIFERFLQELYNKAMEETSDLGQKISEIEAELLNLDHRRSEAIEVLAQLRQELLQKNFPTQPRLPLAQTLINNQSPQGYSNEFP
jgi:hypothetical protein